MSAATILQIVPRLDTGGAELATIEIAAAIVRAGGRALVASEGGRLAPALARAGGELIAFPAGAKNPARMVANAYALARLATAHGVDLIHARSRAPAWSALAAARRARLPFVTTYHGAYGGTGVLKNFYNSVMARGDIVIANSRYTADLIRARHGTPERALRVIHRGVDLSAFDPAKVSPARTRALRLRWGLRERHRIVLHAARLTDWKGQRLVIEAAARLRAQGALGDAVFVLAGDAQGRHAYVADLEQRIAAHGLEGSVRLVGYCADMAAAYLAAHVALVPSIQPEAFGRAAAEAQAMGTPVIASDLGASPETVLAASRVGEEAVTGWLVRPGDADALADAVAAVLALPEESRREIGARGRAHVREAFSLERMRADTLAVYDALLHTALAPAYAAVPGPRKGAARTTGAA